MMIINAFLSAVLQLFLFSIVPIIFYYPKNKTYKGFEEYIGLIAPKMKTVYYSLGISFIFILSSFFIYGWFDLWEVARSPETVAGEIRELGFGASAIVILIIRSIFGTGLSEEILFRGFIGKRLSEKLGFVYGNSIQALLFGLIHGILFFSIAGLTAVIVITSVTGIIGYLLGYLNERLGNGSIVPSWIAHALTNLIAFSAVAFLM